MQIQSGAASLGTSSSKGIGEQRNHPVYKLGRRRQLENRRWNGSWRHNYLEPPPEGPRVRPDGSVSSPAVFDGDQASCTTPCRQDPAPAADDGCVLVVVCGLHWVRAIYMYIPTEGTKAREAVMHKACLHTSSYYRLLAKSVHTVLVR